MAILPIRKLGDPVLRERTELVEANDQEIQKLVKTMEKTMREAQGVGLAATQVGILKRIFIYDIGDGLRVLVNPKVVEEEGTVEDDEGCLSVPGVRVRVKRAEKIRIKAQDLEGNPLELEVEGLIARIFQHEVDHLEGKLILDRCSKEERRRALKEIEKIEGEGE